MSSIRLSLRRKETASFDPHALPAVKKKKAKKKAKKSKGAKPVAITSRIKDVVRSGEMRADGGLADAVNDKVIEMLTNAIARAGANGRKTVRPYDL